MKATSAPVPTSSAERPEYSMARIARMRRLLPLMTSRSVVRPVASEGDAALAPCRNAGIEPEVVDEGGDDLCDGGVPSSDHPDRSSVTIHGVPHLTQQRHLIG